MSQVCAKGCAEDISAKDGDAGCITGVERPEDQGV